MSAEAIEKVLHELKGLPDSDQELVLGFLQALNRRNCTVAAPVPRRGRNPELRSIDNLLIFTGELAQPSTDWLEVVREERDECLMRRALD